MKRGIVWAVLGVVLVSFCLAWPLSYAPPGSDLPAAVWGIFAGAFGVLGGVHIFLRLDDAKKQRAAGPNGVLSIFTTAAIDREILRELVFVSFLLAAVVSFFHTPLAGRLVLLMLFVALFAKGATTLYDFYLRYRVRNYRDTTVEVKPGRGASRAKKAPQE